MDILGMVWGWFWYGLPWEWKAGVVGAAIVAVLVIFRVPPKWIIVVVAFIAAAVGANKLAQDGWRAKERRDMRDAEKLTDKAVKARQRAEKLAPDRLRDDDGFRRD